ncbi:hypothetical protein JOD43_000732 [Pullulanibacillus pueri]|uniref:Uncharacterized protein n=1 Tax=Pullulanibacillus pueri TaxID=1437324 RepID=A0A8J3A1W2_9BACL|nr:hypothetical protein [Pullulanibacillus pueri]MBM7680570.1 hypothetical protein [Pullulanibacillus pueri]GGH88707.1 hypothetical protein GCM10007096_41650 [Pullulanibacillus pueri]
MADMNTNPTSHQQPIDEWVNHLNKPVKVDLHDGKTYEGIMEHLDQDNIYLLIQISPNTAGNEQYSRSFGYGGAGYPGTGYGAGYGGYPGQGYGAQHGGYPGGGYGPGYGAGYPGVGYGPGYGGGYHPGYGPGYPGYGAPGAYVGRLILPLAALTGLAALY